MDTDDVQADLSHFVGDVCARGSVWEPTNR